MHFTVNFNPLGPPRRLNTPIIFFATAYGRHPQGCRETAEAFRMQGFTIRGEFGS